MYKSKRRKKESGTKKYNVRNSKTELLSSAEKVETTPRNLDKEFAQTEKITSVKKKVVAQAKDERKIE